jgi:hypothetical protein
MLESNQIFQHLLFELHASVNHSFLHPPDAFSRSIFEFAYYSVIQFIRFYLKKPIFQNLLKHQFQKKKYHFRILKKIKNNRTHKLMHCPFKIFQNWHLIRMYTCNECFPQFFFLETSSHHVSDGSGPKSAQN